MTKNKLLNLAIIICKILQAAYILILLVLTILFIHIQVDRDFYSDKIVTIEKSNLKYSSSTIIDSDDKVFTLDQLQTSSLYITYIRYSCLVIFSFLGIGEFKKIMKSVQNLKTFQNDNVDYFRRIARYAFLYFIISSFYSYQFNDVGYSGFVGDITSIIIMIGACIMAEIFKEGNLLLVDNNLTI